MIDYQALLTEARFLDTKPVDTHDMGEYICGTASCALGDIGLHQQGMSENDFCAAVVLEKIGILHFTYKTNRYRRTSFEYDFLFNDSPSFHSGYHPNRCDELPAETAARIRKFVYYRLRKAEIFAEYNEALQTGKHAFQCEHGASQESMTQANGRTRELTKVT